MAPVPTPDLWLYFLAVLAVILLPGMDMAYVMASSLAAGRRGAVSSVAGIATGGAIHVVVGATGMAALMVMFPALFRVMLAVGTLYLLWVGWGIYRSATAAAGTANGEAGQTPVLTGIAVYRRAVTTCLLNPKAYAFMFALFPAFVRSDSRSLAAQTLALGLITTVTQVAVYGTVAALALRARAFLQAHQGVIARAMGLLLMAAAVLTASQAWAAQANTASSSSTSSSSSSHQPAATRSAAMIPTFTPGPHEQGRGDFDFFVGNWRAENRRLVRPLDDNSPWETFSGTVHMEKLPGGLGNIDTFLAPGWRPNWMGMTLRLYNPQTGLWSLYWLSSRDAGLDSATGALTPPVVGKFENGVGIFEGDDVINGKPLRVRYTWYDITPNQAKWQQAFSFDGGKTWKPNWFMVETRIQ
jgi:threonine/homoserine/homoserine lactone efflux protein